MKKGLNIAVQCDVCPPVHGDTCYLRALASGLSSGHADNYCLTIVYHYDQCRPFTIRDSSW